MRPVPHYRLTFSDMWPDVAPLQPPHPHRLRYVKRQRETVFLQRVVLMRPPSSRFIFTGFEGHPLRKDFPLTVWIFSSTLFACVYVRVAS